MPCGFYRGGARVRSYSSRVGAGVTSTLTSIPLSAPPRPRCCGHRFGSATLGVLGQVLLRSHPPRQRLGDCEVAAFGGNRVRSKERKEGHEGDAGAAGGQVHQVAFVFGEGVHRAAVKRFTTVLYCEFTC